MGEGRRSNREQRAASTAPWTVEQRVGEPLRHRQDRSRSFTPIRERRGWVRDDKRGWQRGANLLMNGAVGAGPVGFAELLAVDFAGCGFGDFGDELD
jgi:hypothetical protein